MVCTVSTIYGCEREEKKVAQKPIHIEFIASNHSKSLNSKIEQLETLLSQSLGKPVVIKTVTSDHALIDKLASKQSDVAVMSPVTYTIARDKGVADVLLRSKEFAIDEKGNPTHQLSNFYRSQIIVKKESHIDQLKDLKGKKVGLQNVDSASGYIYPVAHLEKARVPKSSLIVSQIKGHEQALIDLLKGNVEAVATYQDVRAKLKKDYPHIYQDTKIIFISDKIPNDTISVRSDLSDDMKDKIEKAFIKVSKTNEGRQLIHDLYGHEGYEVTSNSDFQQVREYRKLVTE